MLCNETLDAVTQEKQYQSSFLMNNILRNAYTSNTVVHNEFTIMMNLTIQTKLSHLKQSQLFIITN